MSGRQVPEVTNRGIAICVQEVCAGVYSTVELHFPLEMCANVYTIHSHQIEQIHIINYWSITKLFSGHAQIIIIARDASVNSVSRAYKVIYVTRRLPNQEIKGQGACP